MEYTIHLGEDTLKQLDEIVNGGGSEGGGEETRGYSVAKVTFVNNTTNRMFLNGPIMGLDPLMYGEIIRGFIAANPGASPIASILLLDEYTTILTVEVGDSNATCTWTGNAEPIQGGISAIITGDATVTVTADNPK